ncbi:MAG TPA: response regulator transcription factor [Rubrobacteraceae bacterium]|nr:response regulator transcription factor [Rubrobacteraceae bacterium]
MRVLLVDDHPTVRFGLKHLLGSAAEVAGEAENAADAVRLAEELRPDLVLLDLRLGEDSGIEVCRELKALPDAPRVLVFTAHTTVEDIAGATLAGADGYLHKGVEGEELLATIERIHAGGRVWLLPAGNEEEAAARLGESSGEARLTPKEKEVFALVLKRRTNPEIAEELYISLYTVKNHVSSILRKLGLKSRREIS